MARVRLPSLPPNRRIFFVHVAGGTREKGMSSAAKTPSMIPAARPKLKVEATPWPGMEWTFSTMA